MNRIALALIFGALASQAQPSAHVHPPIVISKCAPWYTEDAGRAKIEGTVVLYVKITPDGRANSVKVTRSLGMGLDESAVDAVKQWRFRPGRRDGKPITVAITIEVLFRLDRRDRDEPCPAQEDISV
jgi:TonB family protein